ncbi:MAG: nitroreductase family protein [Muribaculaceae bacterium]|nr:nitroreductase family protein [Muribaculaceae bacterium]
MKKTMKKLLMLMAGITMYACSATAQPEGEGVALTPEQQAAYQNIMTRTSIRSWKDKAVEQDKVEMLVRAGMAAPTAVNRQPWHFVVLIKRESIDLLATGRGGGMVRKAPLAIVVCGDMNKALEGPAQEFWVQDASAATENILLAANALGLGAVWTGAYPITERVNGIKEALGLSENLVPLCVILIGYPNENPEPKDKWKPENVTYK